MVNGFTSPVAWHDGTTSSKPKPEPELYYIWVDDEMIQLTLGTALTLLFVTLKLCGVITWPWWSWNPLELSVFILQLYHLTLLLCAGCGYLALRAVRWLRSQE